MLAIGVDARLPTTFYKKLCEELDKKVLLRLPPKLLLLVKHLLFEHEDSVDGIRDEKMDELVELWT